MGRPIKKKFFGSDNVNDGLTYSAAGGEGLASITYTARGTFYSQGLTATVAVSPIAGVRATISSVAVFTANGAINSATIGEAGTGYTTAPAITLVKPATVITTSDNVGYFPDAANLRVASTTGIFVGMKANIGTNAFITNIYSDGNVRANVSFGNISATTPVSFTDIGSGGTLTAVLAAKTVTANTIQANAWTTTSGIGQQADINSQRSSRRYRVSNASDLSDICRLVPTGVNGVNSPTVAQVISAGGPTAAGEMTILATDSDGGVYLVGKLESRTALLFPAAIGGSAGTQFAANSHAIWTSTGVAVEDVSVKLATND